MAKDNQFESFSESASFLNQDDIEDDQQAKMQLSFFEGLNLTIQTTQESEEVLNRLQLIMLELKQLPKEGDIR